MKVIFLDIDGVFNSEQLAERRIQEGWSEQHYDFVDLNELTRFVYFINKNNIKIVLSSSWRIDGYVETCNYLKQTLMAPIIPYLIGVTPRSKSGHRGTEIEFFIKANKEHYEQYKWMMKNNEFIDIDEYCIIDDDCDMTDDQIQNHFVNTNWLEGLQEKHYPQIEKILQLC